MTVSITRDPKTAHLLDFLIKLSQSDLVNSLGLMVT